MRLAHATNAPDTVSGSWRRTAVPRESELVRASKSEQTGSAGVSRVMADFADLDWGPTENVRHDLGVDVFLQVRDERRFDRAVLVAAQVKSGVSYFDGQLKDNAGGVTGWWYAEEDARYFENWVQHGLPHLVILHDPRTHNSYWAHLTKKAVTPCGVPERREGG